MVIGTIPVIGENSKTEKHRGNDNNLSEKCLERFKLTFHINRTDIAVLLIRKVRGKYKQGEIASIVSLRVSRIGNGDIYRSG